LASGENIKFYRVAGSYTYGRPYKNWKIGFIGESRFSIYASTVGGSRNDINASAGTFASRSIADLLKNEKWKWLSLELRGGLVANISNLDDRDYTRFILSSAVSGNWNF